MIWLSDLCEEHPLRSDNASSSYIWLVLKTQELVDLLVAELQTFRIHFGLTYLIDSVWELKLIYQKQALVLSLCFIRMNWFVLE